MKRASALAIIALAGSAGLAQADWIPSSLDQRCDPEDIDTISSGIRDAIEASVRRAEASIEAPHGVGDLSCLNDLMNAPLDIFSNVGGILGSLQGGLMGPGDLGFPIDMEVSGMVCDFAAERWSELTGGLGGMAVGLDGFAATAANPIDRLASGGGWGGSGTAGRFPGSMNLGSSNQPTGTSQTDIPLPGGFDPDIFPDDIPPITQSPDIDQAAFESALISYEAAVSAATAEYTACLAVRNLMLANPSLMYQGGGGEGGGVSALPTCVEPSSIPQPNPEDYIIAMSGASASTAPTVEFRAETGVSVMPSRTIPEAAPRQETPTGSGSNLQDIWDRM